MFASTVDENAIYDIDKKLRAITSKTSVMLGGNRDDDDSDMVLVSTSGDNDDFQGPARQRRPPKLMSRTTPNTPRTPRVPQTPRYRTAATPNAMLDGYELIPKTRWTAVPLGSFVRYIKNDGTLVKGGILLGHTQHGQRDMYRLQFPSVRDKSFCVYLDGLKAVYKKNTVQHVGGQQGGSNYQTHGFNTHDFDEFVPRQAGGSIVHVPKPTNAVSEVGDRLLFGAGSLEERIDRLEKQVARLKNLMKIMHERMTTPNNGGGFD